MGTEVFQYVEKQITSYLIDRHEIVGQENTNVWNKFMQGIKKTFFKSENMKL